MSTSLSAVIMICLLDVAVTPEKAADYRYKRQEKLLKILEKGETEQQRSALWELAYFGNRDALPAVRAALQSPALRAAAIQALIHLGDTESASAILKCLSDPKSTANRNDFINHVPNCVQNAVSGLGITGHAKLVLPALESANPDVRACGVSLLGSLRDPEAILPLIKLLDDPLSRRSAAYGLGYLGDQRAVAPLKKLLQEQAADIRLAAAQALLRLGDDSGKEVYLAGPLVDLYTYTKIKGKAAKPDLIKFLSNKDPSRRAQAARHLGELGDPSVIPVLKELFEKTIPQRKGDSRAALAGALYQLGHCDIVDRLIKDLSNNSADVREDAVLSLPALPYDERGKLGAAAVTRQKAIVEALLPLLRDESKHVRGRTLRALGAIGDPRSLPAVLKTLQGDADLAVDAPNILDGFRHPDADQAIIRLLLDEREEVRREVAEALEGRISMAAVPYLIELLSDNSEEVRSRAEDGLHKITFTSFERLAEWREWWKANQKRSLAELAVEELSWRGHAVKLKDPAESISALIPLVRNANSVTSYIASRALCDLTGHYVHERGAEYHADKSLREEKADSWEKWWKERQGTFKQEKRRESLPPYVPREERKKMP